MLEAQSYNIEFVLKVVPALRTQLAEQGCIESQMLIARELLIQVRLENFFLEVLTELSLISSRIV
jgi:hypothetical protein